MMLDNYPSTFTLVQYHLGDGYQTSWGNTRHTFYTAANGHTGTPEAMFDGTLECYGAYTNVTQMYNWYMTQYNSRHSLPPPVIFRQITGEQVSGQTYEVAVTMSLHPNWGTMPLTFRLYMAQVLDHWPTSPTYSRNGFKQAATEDVTIYGGNWKTVKHNFTFDSTSWASQSNIKIIVWAQEIESGPPADVYNAGQMTWPFPEILPGDANCDGTIDNFDINPFVLALTDLQRYLSTYGCPANVDMNDNGTIDNFDINPFVDALTGG